MRSPFPGVDPYLEQFWGDIRTSLMVYIRDQISDQLPSDLQSRVEESISVDEDESSRWIYPDVTVVEHLESALPSGVAVAEAAIAEPLIVPVPSELPTQRHVEIVDRNSGNRVVTAIELLSPVNKVEGLGRQAYRRKQLDYIAAGVNLVEIDLIRAGTFVVAVPQTGIPASKRTPYVICIRRVQRPNQAEIIAVAIEKPVPNFRIPLRPADLDIVLQLQLLLDDCYRRGRYASIDYNQPPHPKLDERTTAWANDLLRKSKPSPPR